MGGWKAVEIQLGRYWKFFVFVLSLCYSFNHIFWGFDFIDTFYWINLCEHYQSSPMVSGSLVLGSLWSEVFGNALISYRLLAWVLGVLAVFLPYLILIPKKLWTTNLYYLSLAIILSRNPIFGADVVTVFVISISLIFAIKFYQTHKICWLLLFGLSSSYAVFVRFPNILLFFVFIFCLLFIESVYEKFNSKIYWRSFLRATVIYIFIYFGGFILFSSLLHNGISDYLDNICLSIVSTLTSNSQHSFRDMIYPIPAESLNLIMYIGVLFLIEFIVKFCYFNKIAQIYKVLLFSFALALFTFFIRLEVMTSFYDHNLKVLFSAIFYYLILKFVYIKVSKQEYSKLIYYLLVVSITSISIMGSNTGFLKLSATLMCFFPMLLTELEVFVKSKVYVIPFLLVFLIFVVLSFEDRKMHELTKQIESINKLRYIHTTPAKVNFIEDVMDEFQKIKDPDNVLFFGPNSHLFYYLTNIKPLYNYSFSMDGNDIDEVAKIEKLIKNRFLIIFYLNSKEENSKLENMLLDGYYIVQKKEGYKIFITK